MIETDMGICSPDRHSAPKTIPPLAAGAARRPKKRGDKLVTETDIFQM